MCKQSGGRRQLISKQLQQPVGLIQVLSLSCTSTRSNLTLCVLQSQEALQGRPDRNGRMPKCPCLQEPSAHDSKSWLILPPPQRKLCAAEQAHTSRDGACTPYAKCDSANGIFHAFLVISCRSHTASKARGFSSFRAEGECCEPIRFVLPVMRHHKNG